MVESTHHVTVRGDRVFKTYRHCYDDEHRREWTALRLLHRYAPGLALEPIWLRTNRDDPTIQMSRVPGRSLGRSRLTGRETYALGVALRRLHASLPDDELVGLPRRRWAPAALTDALPSWLNQSHETTSADVETALDVAAHWVDGPEAADYTGADVESALAHGDGNIGNFVLDGDRCSIVDFEDSGHGDPAYEVADLVEHVTVSLPGLLDPDRLVRAVELTPEQERRYSAYRSVDRQARHVLELLT